MKASNDQNSETSLLIEEFKQAWEHYRHLENTRSKYITTALTFFLSAMAFNGLMFRLESKLGPDLFIVLLLANAMVLFFSYYLRQSVLAIRPVLEHYGNVMTGVRHHIYNDGEKMDAEFSARQNEEVKARANRSRVQPVAESLLATMIFFTAIVEIVIAAKLLIS